MTYIKKYLIDLPKTLFSGGKEVSQNFFEDGPFAHAAALSFYALLSIAPLLLVVTAAAGMLFGKKAMQGQIAQHLKQIVGPNAAKVIQSILANAGSSGSGITLVIGIALLLIGTTSVFVQLQRSLNDIWNVKHKPAHAGITLWILVRGRLISLVMVFLIWAILLISIVANIALTAAKSFITQNSPRFAETWWIWAAANEVFSLVIITVLIALVFKILPDIKIGWNKVWIGSIITALMFWAGKYAIGLYLGHASIVSAYGAAGSLVALLVWVYYSSVIIFLGAEITKVYTRKTKGNIQPSKHAEITGDN